MRPLGSGVCPSLCQAVEITRLSTLVYVMWSVALFLVWAGLLWNRSVHFCFCGFPLIIWSSLSIRRLHTLCCSGGFASIRPCSRNACLLLSPHYPGLVSFSVVWSCCFLSLKTESSVFVGQRPLGSALLWGREEGLVLCFFK